MGSVFISVRPLPPVLEAASLRAYLERCFPIASNSLYVDALMGSIPRVTIARLGALSLLPPLLRAAGIEPASLSLLRDEHGRPYARTSDRETVFDFNLSHSNAHTACALLTGCGRVGIDIEEPLTIARAEPLIWRYCTESEKRILADLSPEKAAEGFTRLWTVREAMAKQSGQGMPLRYDATRIPPELSIKYGHVSDTETQLSVCFPACIGFDQIHLSADSLPVIWT